MTISTTMMSLLCICVTIEVALGTIVEDNFNRRNLTRRALTSTQCDPTALNNARYAHYFEDMNKIYRGQDEGTCLPVHQKCGWPQESFDGGKKFPLYVLVVGLEGSGHHFWTKLLFDPLFQCNWVGD